MSYLKTLVLTVILSTIILPVSAFVVSTNDGLQISLFTNEPMKIAIDGVNLPQSALSQSGFFSGRIDRTVSQDQPIHGTFTNQGSQIIETASTNEFTIVSKYTGLDKMIRVDTTITNTLNVDQGRSLVFKLPLNLDGWTWGDDISTSRVIASSGVYKNSGVDESVPYTLSQGLAVYPLASISSSDRSQGLSIAVPMDQPRVVEIQYLPGEYSIMYKFALSNSTVRFPNNASFTFYIYKNDQPEWGFRGALKKYYELFPQFFTKRVTREGSWIYFIIPSGITNAEDFGFQFNPTWAGDNVDMSYDNSHGVYALTYTEPFDFTVEMSDYTSQPTHADILNRIEEIATATPWTVLPGTNIVIEPYKQAFAKACNTSCGYDSTGNYPYVVKKYPWISRSGWAGLMSQNSDPLISSPSMAEAVWKYMINDKFAYQESKGNWFDGVYFDSFSGTFYNTENYRTDQFSNIPFPLQWSVKTNRPVLIDVFTHYMFTEQVASSMHNRGKYTMANDPNSAGLFFYHLFDIAGNEVSYTQGGQYAPESDQTMNYRRSLMYQKPYALISYDDLSGSSGHDIVEKYFKQCTHYAMFPSMEGSDSTNTNYFANPTLYNRDRPLFKKYIPIIQELAKAGWEPVTFASTSTSGVSLERYGPSAGVTYFSVHNPSLTGSKIFNLIIDKSTLSLGSAKLSVVELIGNQSINFTTNQNTLSIPVTLASADTKVYKVQFATVEPGPIVTLPNDIPDIEPEPSVSIPEFPSACIPVIMTIGFLVIGLLIHTTREN